MTDPKDQHAIRPTPSGMSETEQEAARLMEERRKAEANNAPPPEEPPKPEEPKQPFAVFPDSKTFEDRVSREAKKMMKETFGGRTPEEIQSEIEAYNKLKADEEDRRKSQMSEAERLREERDQYKNQFEEAQQAREEAELAAHLGRVFAAKGIRNHDYAQYKLIAKLSELEEGQELDENAYLDELLEDASEHAALMGKAAAAESVTTRKGKTTTTTDPRQDPKPAQAGGGEAPVQDAFQLTREEFQKKLAKEHNFHGAQVGGS